MASKIVFTGGSGKAGRHVVPYLKGKGHDVFNLDLKPLDCPGVTTLACDLTDGAQVYSALSMHFDFDSLASGSRPVLPDAVVHFAAVPRILLTPDNLTFDTNVMSTYNVIEAAMKLGIRKVIIASSETTYGVCFAEGDKDFHQFPLTEDYDTESFILPSARTDLASRSSMPSMTRSRPASRPGTSSRRSVPIRRMVVRLSATKPRSPTRRSGPYSASKNSTTGANTRTDGKKRKAVFYAAAS